MLPESLSLRNAQAVPPLTCALQVDEPVKAYQATFDTPAGDWTTVRLPWHEFVPVNMAKYNPEAGPLDPSKVSSLGLVYSRFDLNGVANPNHSPGALPQALLQLD